ncbi:MAG TPA: thioredoxin [Chloroflexi bacterium]|nr:thioredoxin [Chloroflexota bacterium]
MFDTPVTVNDQTFEKWVLKNELPVVASFCTPRFQKCRDLQPLLDRLAKEFAGKAVVTRLEVDDNREWARRYSIRDLPTVLFVRKGEIRDRVIGLPEWGELRERTAAFVEGRAPRVSPKPAPGSAPSRAPVVVTDATFERVILQSNKPALVDFWADWCGPCHMIAPHVEALAREMGDRAIIAKLNVDENPRTADRYGVQSIPTLLIFKNGQPVDRIVGAQPAHMLRQRLQAQL